MSCEAVGYLTIMQLTANEYLMVARPCIWMELMAQSVSWFYPSFPGRYLRDEVSSNCLGLGFCLSQRYFLFRMAELFSYQSSFYAKMCGYYGSKWLLYEY